jgi:hypothetical protein
VGSVGSVAQQKDIDMTTPTPADPSWYEDPSGEHEYRYWDGSDWTHHVHGAEGYAIHPISEPSTPPPAPRSYARGPVMPAPSMSAPSEPEELPGMSFQAVFGGIVLVAVIVIILIAIGN